MPRCWTERPGAACSFVPYVFDPARRDFYRMSFPGKTAYYFAGGSPVVVQAPHDSAIAGYFRRHELNFMCNTLDGRVLADTLKRACALGPSERISLRTAYRRVVEEHHLASKTRDRLLGRAEPARQAAAAAAA